MKPAFHYPPDMEPAMTDVHDPRPAARLSHAYALWSESGGARSDQWIELLADGIEMRSVLTPDLPDDLAATRRSLSGALEYFQTVARDWEMIDFTVERFVDGGDDVVMVGRCAWRNRATARIVDTPKVDVWRFENGKAVRFLEMFDSLGFVRAIPFGDVMGLN
jgi:ketosteroid isomerase-like protein